MKTILCRLVLFLLFSVASISFGDVPKINGAVPKINIEVAELGSGKTAYKGVTDTRGIFATPKLDPGSYAVVFTSKSTPKGSHYTLVLVAGAKKMAANAITTEKLAAGGVAMKIEVSAGRSILGQVSEEDKATRIGKNGKLMVWIPKQINSNLPAHWAESDSADAKFAETASSFSIKNIQDRQNAGINPGD